LEYPIDEENAKKFHLAEYAAEHFAVHAEFENAIAPITDAIDYLLDVDKPHFRAWMSYLRSSRMEEKGLEELEVSPLYYVAEFGLPCLAQRLLLKRPQDAVARAGPKGTPVHVALHRRHVKVCQLLLPHCIGKDVRTLMAGSHCTLRRQIVSSMLLG